MSNGRLTHLLAFESYEAPMMRSALCIARNTAMMCGGRGQERLQAMLDEVTALVPAISRLFDEEEFADMGAALQSCTEFSVRWLKVGWKLDWDPEGRLAVVMDGQIVCATKAINIHKDSPLIGELVAYLSEIAPCTASFVPSEVDA